MAKVATNTVKSTKLTKLSKIEIDELCMLNEQSGAIEKRIKQLKERAKEHMPLGEHKGNTGSITISTQSRAYFDGKQFKEDHPAIAAKYTSDKDITIVNTQI